MTFRKKYPSINDICAGAEIMKDFLRDYQRKAVSQMRNGCILNGGVGSGKSRTGIYYYFKEQGGKITDDEFVKMKNPKDLYIITTARKRDIGEWEAELAGFGLNTTNNKIVIDSWNNIKKYVNVTKSFFIFDEDKITGYGTWAKTFLKITKNNNWIVLSATAGDCWMDYMTIFIANGYFRNKTDFINQHVEYDRFCSKYPKIKCYHNTGRLLRLRNRILINMDFERSSVRNNIDIYCDYDRLQYKDLFKTRWNYEKDTPIENASELCYQARKIVNSSEDRLLKLLEIIRDKRRVIIFYNFDYELELMKNLLEESGIEYTEWNGHLHQSIPKNEVIQVLDGNKIVDAPNTWAYLVQYNAGAEGWNCITTNTIIFFSQNYSYKMMEQASGRIDRMNTPFHDLYYYHLKSRSPIDVSITKALTTKRKFNETKFVESIS